MGELTDAKRDEIIAALAERRKIDAIKLYRDATGTDLADAKEFIEQLQVRLYEEHPERFPNPRVGCSVVLLVCGIAVGILVPALW